MEVRGIGIIDVKQILDLTPLKKAKRVDYVIKLIPLKDGINLNISVQ